MTNAYCESNRHSIELILSQVAAEEQADHWEEHLAQVAQELKKEK